MHRSAVPVPLLAVVVATLVAVTGASVAGGGAPSVPSGDDEASVTTLPLLTLAASTAELTDAVGTAVTTSSTSAARPSTTTTTTAPTTTTTAPPAPTTTPTVPTPAPPPPSTTPPAPPAVTADPGCATSILGWINDLRASEGLPGLTADGGIAGIPGEWSRAMAERQSLAHNPEAADRIFAARPAGTVGEIVGYGSSARAVHGNFVGSPSHREKMVAPEFTHAAAGCVDDGQGTLWVAVDFWG